MVVGGVEDYRGEIWRKAEQGQPATFIFELLRVEKEAGLKGGSIRL